jgi:hypothetical protein
MNYRYLLIFLTILIIPFISADRVGVLIDFPDGSTHVQCIEAEENTNGYDLLNDLSLSTIFAGPGSFGHQLCQINGVGDSVSGTGCSFGQNKYWRFLNGINNVFEYMPVGFDGGSSCWNGDLNSFNGHYCVQDGDVVGLSYGEFSDSRPSFQSFEDICNPLTVNKIKVSVDGKRESDADENGGEIEAEPGDEIVFKIELENTFEFDDDLEIEDIEVEVTIIDVDDGSDLDEDISFKDLEVDEDDTEKISITLPFVLEDDDYDIELRITGETSEGIEQEIIINYDLNIDKEKHDLKFTKLNLDSDSSCSNAKNVLSLEVSNLGEKDEDDVRLSVKSQELNIDFAERFDIDEGDSDDTYKKELHFSIPNIQPGDYNIDLILDYSKLIRKEISLTVKDCNQQQAPITGSAIKESNNKLTTNQATPQTQTFQTQTFLQNYAIPILLAIFLLFLIIAIIYIVSIL